jgi:hypothetical protein
MNTNDSKSYENYPIGIVILSNFVSIAIYVLGFLIISKTGWIFAFIYLLYILILELRLIKNHCTKCFYWGKTCGFGKGRLSAFLFKKGDSSKFCSKNMTWKDMIPDILVSLIPLLTGIIVLIFNFDFILLFALLLLLILTTSGNGFIRGKLTCEYYKQKETCCSAYELFNKGK